MSAEIIQIRDFQREAIGVRLPTRPGMAELIAESVCELGWSSDTAPSEMHYHGDYIAPQDDPA